MAIATVSITLLVMLLSSHSEVVKPVLATLPVFEAGSISTKAISVKESKSTSPKPLFIISPTIGGKYPVFLFFHGTCTTNSVYRSLLEHIASHGYIVVAPQLYNCPVVIPTISGNEELNYAANVANWLLLGLKTVLPENVEGNLDQLAVSGHSRGGKTAFALALGYAKIPLEVTISVLVGVDPVAGLSKECRCDPKILKFFPHSFDLSIPVTVIGSGLGDQKFLLFPPCAPSDLNHMEFYLESKPPIGYFVATDYGHMDILDDYEPRINICKGNRSRDPLRRTVGGIIVAFLNGYFRYETKDYLTIANNASVAPVNLSPARFINETQESLLNLGNFYSLKFDPTCPFDWIPDCHASSM
ncbi:hypothetical protein P3X46_003481 [Hevea brasiliensis]|uniref:Chlorophyllase n=1 Tax=Hevea brasiliensis TaxID=3981 RepID=A0ABQ9N753_HEVBR|nr:chlorophyllase-1, chloroplastic [Hevea brasiliensis]KAJ9188088.1 hypothetical protein P3X46_003481 [Hevea brasiliensis]